MDTNKLKKEFINMYGKGEGERVFFAPGRVNLIGEHTDYSGGYVFPCAIGMGIYGVARKRSDAVIHLASTNEPLRVETNVNYLTYKENHAWANYPKGVIAQFQAMGHTLAGMDILISGDLPVGSGLSSSACIQVLTGIIVNSLYNCGLDMIEIVKTAQKSEKEFMGVACGIMDQFASGMGKKGMAILLNCAKVQYDYVPLKMPDYSIIISNTNKKRELTDSKYNERVAECSEALRCLQQKLPVSSLSSVTVNEFEENKQLITDAIICKRAEHVIYENHRVLRACERLRRGDVISFGRLMNESHASLRNLYAVTGPELNAIVEEAMKIPGVIGSRMTGAGFGGCSVSLVRNSEVDTFIKKVGGNYKARTRLTASFYVVEPSDGARELRVV